MQVSNCVCTLRIVCLTFTMLLSHCWLISDGEMVDLTFNTAGMLMRAATFSYYLYEDLSATEMKLIDWNYLNNSAAGSEIGAIC